MKDANDAGAAPPTSAPPRANDDVKKVLGLMIVLVLAFHIGSALRGQAQFRDIHLGTALHYAQARVDLADTLIIGFNATGTPTLQELPLWQMAAGLAFKWFGPWWGWANVVALVLFLSCLFPLFQIARLFLDERCAWWTLVFFLAEPLVFLYAGTASTDGFSLAITIWFLYFGMRLLRSPDWKWLLVASATGSLAAVSKLPFFMAAGLGLFFMSLASPGFNFKRLGFLAASGGLAGMVFLAWTHYTDSQQSRALFPFVDLRMGKGPTMMFWFFGDWHYRLSAGNWIKGGWRSLNALLGSSALAGLIVLAHVNRKGNLISHCLLAGALLTTLVFTHLVLHHWHYYLMFAPAVAILCAKGFSFLEMKFSPPFTRPVFGVVVTGLLGLSLLQGLMAMHALTYDPYPARIADLIRQHTSPSDKLVVVGGGWGGLELFSSRRQGLSVWNLDIFERPEDLAKLKSLGYTKLVMISQSPFLQAIQVVNPGQAATARERYGDKLTPQVEPWPTVLQTEDILIKEIP